MHKIIIVSLACYFILMSLPFLPGAEIGLTLLTVFGGAIAPAVYVATVLALALAFALGRLVPIATTARILRRLGQRRAADQLSRLDGGAKRPNPGHGPVRDACAPSARAYQISLSGCDVVDQYARKYRGGRRRRYRTCCGPKSLFPPHRISDFRGSGRATGPSGRSFVFRAIACRTSCTGASDRNLPGLNEFPKSACQTRQTRQSLRPSKAVWGLLYAASGVPANAAVSKKAAEYLMSEIAFLLNGEVTRVAGRRPDTHLARLVA